MVSSQVHDAEHSFACKRGGFETGMVGVGRRKKRGFGGVISPERTFDIPVVCPYQSALLLLQHHLQL
jgi:hypothetical protein